MVIVDDLSGKIFGEWTVIERAIDKTKSKGAKYLCRCSCGTERIVFGKNLRNGTSKSCGCLKRKDYTGTRFGKLVVQSVGGSGRQKFYTCKCDCGNIVDIPADYITQIKSCGCSRHVEHRGERYGSLVIDETLFNLKGDRHTYVSCTCDCGVTGFITRYNGLRTGNTRSCGCAHSPNLIGKRFGRLTVEEEIENSTTQRRWLCKCDCGSFIEASSHTLTSGHTRSCGCLKSEQTSYAEIFVRGLLEQMGICYIPEKTFADCVGINGYKLRFDLFLPDYNTAIECDGEQHFHSIPFFGGMKSYTTLKENDAIKDEYCKNTNITLLRLPYTYSDDEITEAVTSLVLCKNPVTITA